jgi:hypothetical protein
MSSAYQKFVKEYLEANSWAERKDGAPVEIIDELISEEKEKAEEELIKRLSIGDDWAAIGLGYMKSAKAAPALYALLPQASGSVKAQIATALWKICEDEEMLKVVLNLSQPSSLSRLSPYYEFRQIDIIYCLAQFPQSEARAKLEELTKDEKFLVSYNAKRALVLRKNYYNIST